MGIFVRHFKSIILLSVIMTSTGCALTSGLQTYDLPEEGIYQTDLGTHVNVVKLTQTSLPAAQLAQYNQEYFAHLFNIPQKNYKLSAGDILSIYLWAILKLHHQQIPSVMKKLSSPMAIKLIKVVISNFLLLVATKPQESL